MSTGATHAPHQVSPEYIAKYKGKFDMGWDVYREQTFARQKKLGVVPQNAKLTQAARASCRRGTRSRPIRRGCSRG